MSSYEDTSAVVPSMVDIRRAAPAEIRRALMTVRYHLHPDNTSGLEDVMGTRGGVPSEGTSQLLRVAQRCGRGGEGPCGTSGP